MQRLKGDLKTTLGVEDLGFKTFKRIFKLFKNTEKGIFGATFSTSSKMISLVSLELVFICFDQNEIHGGSEVTKV